MARSFALLVMLSMLLHSAAARELLYQLVFDRGNADLNYALLEEFQQREKQVDSELAADAPPPGGYTMRVDTRDIERLFYEVRPGHGRILTFCALEIGRHPEPLNGRLEFIAHHLLVLKANEDGRLVDGFYFIREWAESPALRLLLQFRAKERFLSKELKITKADFRQVGGGEPEHFDPTGRLDNLLGFKEAF